jgi:hypothetical protein
MPMLVQNCNCCFLYSLLRQIQMQPLLNDSRQHENNNKATFSQFAGCDDTQPGPKIFSIHVKLYK